MSMQLSRRQRGARVREKDEGAVSTLVHPVLHDISGSFSFPLSLCHCPSEKSKAACAGSRSHSVPSTTGVFTGVLTGVLLEGCRLASPPAKVFS